MRAFLAVPSDPLWVEKARGLVERFRGTLPRASWTRPESWHLTLQFLGDVDPGVVRRFSEAIAPAAVQTVPAEVQAAPAVVFPERGRPRVLGVGFSPSPGVEAIARLATLAQEAAGRLGWTGENRPFHPHVTFARIRDHWPATAVADYRRGVEAWSFPAWLARSCVLFESRLESSGAVHTPLAEWSFQGGPQGVRA
ncbi:MAG TPA: RNA 2',3'-cyclic phosphodiesterase [Thermoanaerobaculia bacterium]|nr:RNA 2',3'-cyclic phosphodiesterase [Thermoanaerobaculia bacterium]